MPVPAEEKMKSTSGTRVSNFVSKMKILSVVDTTVTTRIDCHDFPKASLSS